MHQHCLWGRGGLCSVACDLAGLEQGQSELCLKFLFRQSLKHHTIDGMQPKHLMRHLELCHESHHIINAPRANGWYEIELPSAARIFFFALETVCLAYSRRTNLSSTSATFGLYSSALALSIRRACANFCMKAPKVKVCTSSSRSHSAKTFFKSLPRRSIIKLSCSVSLSGACSLTSITSSTPSSCPHNGSELSPKVLTLLVATLALHCCAPLASAGLQSAAGSQSRIFCHSSGGSWDEIKL